MGFYSTHILPHVIDLSMRNRELRPYRERVIARAQGRVLEIGIGSGANLPYYGSRVDEILGLEPASGLMAMARRTTSQLKHGIKFITASAEAIPIEDHSIDTVVTTWTLCSIPDVVGALKEMRRVLRTDGQLLFVEHGLAPEDRVQRWQHRLTPLWKMIGGGCHLNRPIPALIERAGFAITQLDTGYMKGPKPMTFLYEGRAATLLK
jgi:ubiquinone/menaquinone biosynthesis C-methylase UbiE